MWLESSRFVHMDVTANSQGGTLHICTSVNILRVETVVQSKLEIAPLCSSQFVATYRGGVRSKLRIIGNFCPQTIMGAKWEWLYIRAYNIAVWLHLYQPAPPVWAVSSRINNSMCRKAHLQNRVLLNALYHWCRKVSINSISIYLNLKIAPSRENGHKAKLEHFRGNKDENCQKMSWI
jgi:hypothetical protein